MNQSPLLSKDPNSMPSKKSDADADADADDVTMTETMNLAETQPQSLTQDPNSMPIKKSDADADADADDVTMSETINLAETQPQSPTQDPSSIPIKKSDADADADADAVTMTETVNLAESEAEAEAKQSVTVAETGTLAEAVAKAVAKSKAKTATQRVTLAETGTLAEAVAKAKKALENPLLTHTERQNTSTRKTTFINGIGLWHSWTRNFKTPLLAVLDLLDNAFDAGFSTFNPNFKSKIYITEDKWMASENNFTSVSATPFQESVTGMVIANNSADPICDILSILEVYKSAKADCESIGENGVGLKQGCATISDLSFVLIRSNEKMAIGVIAKDLQHEAGAYLPSYPLELEGSIREQLEKIFKVDDPEVGKSAAAYGFGDLKIAIDRLVKHIEDMCSSSTWGDEKHVFRLIMDKLRYRNARESSQESNYMEDGDPYRRAVNGLMQEIKSALPSQYIHIPETFDVKVGMEKVYFNFWQTRLAELSVFYVKIDPDNSFRVSDDWMEPAFGYHIRVFVGFDPIRFLEAEDPKSSEIKTLSLHLYSRKSGRLIRHDPDGRSILGLTAGGTNFCQGLTVIVDDFAGQLPLNPTKQDVAFSEQANGSVHEKNLYLWINAIAGGYYNYILDFFNGRKGDLSNGVKGVSKKLKKLYDQRCDPKFHINSLAKGRYTNYTRKQLPFRRLNGKIICNRSEMTQARIEGCDTQFCLFTQNAMVVKEEETREMKRTKRIVKSKKKTPVKSPVKRARLEEVEVVTIRERSISPELTVPRNSRYPSRSRRSSNVLSSPDNISSSSSPSHRLLTGGESDAEVDDTKPPALTSAWQLEAERWKATAEKQTRDSETWKTRARLLKAQYTQKKVYYEDALRKKEEELAIYKKLVGKAGANTNGFVTAKSSSTDGEPGDALKSESPI